MTTQELSCPACSAPLAVENRFSRVVICQYCGQTSQISSSGLDPQGQATTLVPAPSRLHVGASGRLNGEAFRALGRLRYQYDGGFWDEWFCQTAGGQSIWLQEDDGELTAYRKQALTSPVPAFEDIRVGSMIPLNGASMFVTERCEAMIAGGEGELFFSITPGETVNCVDGNAAGDLLSIEFTPDEINLSSGLPIAATALIID